MPAAEYAAPLFQSVTSITRSHVELMKSVRDARKPEEASKFAATVISFMRQVADAGAKLQAEDQRIDAQNILDYWNAWLLTSGAGKEISDSPPTNLVEFDETTNTALPLGKNPFKPLAALGLKDQDLFFGRGDAIAAVVDLIRRKSIVFVSGPPGSGRTSLVMAGVAARLKNNPDNSPHIRPFSPGTDPLRALAQILPIRHRPSADELLESPERLREKIDTAWGGKPALVVVDNAEQLFTGAVSLEKQERFAEALASLADPRRHTVILIVADDQAEQLLKLPALKPYVSDAHYPLPPPTVAQIQKMLTASADRKGLRMDAGCVEELAGDLKGDPAGFALGRFLLLRLWDLSEGGVRRPRRVSKT